MTRLLSLAATLALTVTALAADRKPNVVFILADDLGWTDLGCQGSKYYESPNIDKLAAAGLRFTDAYTCGPNCQPTRAALMSGQYGPRTGVYTVGGIDRYNDREILPEDVPWSLPCSVRSRSAGSSCSSRSTTAGPSSLASSAGRRSGWEQAQTSVIRNQKSEPTLQTGRGNGRLTDRPVPGLTDL